MMKHDMDRERRWIGDSIKDFEFIQLLGVGAFATVHEAKCMKQGSFKDLHVAIKKIRKIDRNKEDLEKRVRQEIQIHSSLHHPSIVKFYTSFEDHDFFYLVLELCQNGSLEEYLKKKQRPFSENETRQILMPIIHGIMYMHKHKIIHRDLTLRNLLLTEDMQVKVADFGLAAKLLCPDDKKHTMLGTANFMSPEVVTRTPHDLATDCWGLGIILYVLLIGRPPFDNGGVKRTLTDIVMCDYKLPDDLSSDSKHLISSLLKKNPEERLKIDAVLKHPFFTNNKHYSISSSHYSQKTMDSGLGSTGILSSVASSMSTQSRYHPSSIVKKNLDTIHSSGYSYHSADNSSQIFQSTDAYCEKNNKQVLNAHQEQFRNDNKHENIGFKQLKHKIPTLPSKQPEFLRPFPEPLNNFHRNNATKEKVLDDRCFRDPISNQVAYSEDKQHSSKNCRNVPDHRSKSNSPVRHCERKNYCMESHKEAECIRNCHNYLDYDPASHHNSCEREYPAYHSPRNQCIDNNHRGNSRSPTGSPSLSQASGRSCNCCKTDYKCNNEVIIPDNNYQASHRDKYEESPINHHPASSCSHDRYCSDDNALCSHISACACHTKNSCAPTSSNFSRNTHSTIKHSSPVSEVTDSRVKQNIPPLNSSRLTPRKQHGKNSVISILKDGDVCLEFIKERRNRKIVTNVFRISKDGMWITVYKPSTSNFTISDEPAPVPESGADFLFSFKNLPDQHWKKYNYASRFVNYIRAKTAKITFYGTVAKGVMMENAPDPDFEASFYDGGKVTKSSNRIAFVTKSGRMLIFNEEGKVTNLSEDTSDMWREYIKIRDTCRTIEKSLETAEATLKSLFADDVDHSFFPAVLGRKPGKFILQDNSNKENNTPSSMRSSMLNAASVRSFDGTISTCYSPSDVPSQKYFIEPGFKRPSSKASLRCTGTNSTVTSKLTKNMKDVLPKVDHLEKDKEGNFCVKFKDGIDLYSSKALTGIHIFDRFNGKSYDGDGHLPPQYQEKLCDAARIALHLEEQRKMNGVL